MQVTSKAQMHDDEFIVEGREAKHKRRSSDLIV